METRGLLFIPDISGFTRFVTEMEIGHSRQIIQELLEILIDSNEIGLEVSEVEGDAILFYKYGDKPSLEQVYQQVEKMFCAFHLHLMAYEYRRFCQCKACTTAINLSLKVVTHYGEFTSYNVKNFYKLIGKDVIVAHQLLKNDIKQHEYWLITSSMTSGSNPSGFARWMKWNSSSKQTETGEIPFHYTQLSALKNELPPPKAQKLELTDKVKMLFVSKEFDATIKKLFFTIGHYELRHQWQIGVKEVAEVDHILPGIGTRYRYILDNGQKTLVSSSFSYDPERKIEFSETDEKKKHSIYYILEKTGNNRCRVTLEYYIQRNPLQQLLFNWTEKKKLREQLQKSLDKLDALVKQVQLPVDF